MNDLMFYKHYKNRALELQREAAQQRSARTATQTDTTDKLWNKNFSLYWLGIASAALGDALIYIALPFLILDISNSPKALATTILLGSLPRFLGPVLGTLADRLPLKIPLTVATFIRASLFIVIGYLALQQELSQWMIYGAALLNGLITYFVFSAGSVLLPTLVPQNQLARANSFTQAAMQGIPLIGLGVAGAMVAAFGSSLTILFATPFLAVFTVVIPFLTFPTRKRDHVKSSFARDLLSAATFIRKDSRLSFMVLTTLILNLTLNTVNVTMPVLMERLGQGARGYGLFEATLALGVLLGIGCVSLIGERVPLVYKVSIGKGLFGLGFVLLAFGSFSWFICGAFFLGLSLGFTEVAAMTFSQLIIPDGMRGKVLGLKLSSGALGLTLGAWLGGQVAQYTELAYTVSAVAVFILCVAWTLLNVQRGRTRGVNHRTQTMV
jgi:MFS family permease